MKRKWYAVCAAGICLALMFGSCKTAPQQEAAREPAPATSAQPAGTSQAAIDALNQALARAEAARKRALDFESSSYFPSDWEEAEGQYNAAKNLPVASDPELQQAASAFNAVADSYDSLFEKTIPLYAQAREDEIVAARETVIATGLVPFFPEYLPRADAIALAALNQYEAKDYYEAQDTAAQALAEYQLLKTGADAYLMRQEILDRDFSVYDPDNFTKAEEAGALALDAYNAGDAKTAADGAEEALLRYNLVLSTAWAAYAADRRNFASTERKKAVDTKANIAVRDSFSAAEMIFTHAETVFRDEEYEDASALYTEAEARFIIVQQEAEKKRRLAENAIKEAEEKIEASEETAKQAEIKIGGSL